DVVGADQLNRLARSRLVAERDPLVTLDFELELRAHRGREGSGARVGPGEGESPVVAREPARGSDELLDAVRALERPQVVERARGRPRAVPAARPAGPRSGPPRARVSATGARARAIRAATGRAPGAPER